MKKRYLIIAAVGAIVSSAAATNLNNLANVQAVGKVIGWIPQNNTYNICGGYYKELPIPYTANPLISSQAHNYDIHADHIDWSVKGTSTLKGNVRITQPGKQLNADQINLYRDKQTGKVNRIDLLSNVRVFEPGTLLAAKHATVYPATKKIHFSNAAYRMKLSEGKKTFLTQEVVNPEAEKQEIHIYGLNFWGTAKTIDQTKPDYYVLKNATYTTCSPTCHTWDSHSTTITLDKKGNEGKAWNSVLYWEGVPVFYLPYYTFPLKNERKTGFLWPSYGTSSQSGFTFTLPFYWNIAPNYDALLRAHYFSERGIMGDAKARYLTNTSNGFLEGSFLPHDRKFAEFKKDAPGKYSSQPDGLNNLKSDSDNRYGVHWYNQSTFNPDLKSEVDYSDVSDDYYTQDFGNNYINSSNNQLLQKGDVSYQTNYWNFYGLLQGYQTLHPVNELQVQNQYERLPELQANAFYPDIWHGFDVFMDNDIVNFYQAKTPDDSTIPVIGERLSVRPGIDYPITRSYGYFIPRAQLQMTRYQLRQIGSLRENNPGIAIPIFDVRAGLTFDRQYTLFHHQYLQTLEPNFYYLYVPYRNQNDLPIFDTNVQQFSYSTLYLDNRFGGIDRMGDANQVTYGVTSRFIDEQTGSQLGSASVGEIFYLRNRDVQLCSLSDPTNTACTQSLPSIDKNRFSPIAGQATYNIFQDWSLSGGIAWDPETKLLDNGSATIGYKEDPNHIVNFNYSYTRSIDNTGGVDTDPLKQVGVSSYWQVKRHWDLIGAWDYDWSQEVSNKKVQGHGTAYMGGVGYESCCWAVRAVALRVFNRIDTTGRFVYNNAYFVQFVLRGFGDISSNDPAEALQQHISGYTDTFTQAN